MSPYTAARRTSPARVSPTRLATILSCAMMLRWSFGLAAEADAIEAAVEGALNAGLRCGDVRSPGATVVGTVEMGDAAIARL